MSKIENGHYVEVKGIIDAEAKAKVACFPFPIELWVPKEMKPYLEYMEHKYGRNWRKKF